MDPDAGGLKCGAEFPRHLFVGEVVFDPEPERLTLRWWLAASTKGFTTASPSARPSECRQGGLESSFGELPVPDLSKLTDRERWCCEGIVIVVGAKEM
jgi:hypothetical protein